MQRFFIATALVSGLALAGCDYDKDEYNEANAAYEAEGNEAYDTAQAGETYDAARNWPAGTRIVAVDNVYYRVDPSGTRVRLEPGDSTIVVENGIRYRVDPGGTRVRIDEEGAAISVGPGGVDATVPVDDDVRVEVNSN